MCASRGVRCWEYSVVQRRAVIQNRGFYRIRRDVLHPQLQNHVCSRDYNTAALKWTCIQKTSCCEAVVFSPALGELKHQWLTTMPCLKLSGGAISIFFEIWGRNCGGPEAASDVVQLSLLQALHPASKQQEGGGCQCPLHHLSACDLELWCLEMWLLLRWFK